MTSVVVSDGGGNIVEYVTVVEESQQVSVTSLYMIQEPLVNIFFSLPNSSIKLDGIDLLFFCSNVKRLTRRYYYFSSHSL